MFTGIIEDVGTVRDIDDRGESMRLRIDSPIIDGADHGDSVSVNGVCLTVAGHDDANQVAKKHHARHEDMLCRKPVYLQQS